jgi:hypothetical protein
MTDTTRELTKDEQLQEIGRNAYASIVEMVAALQCDYERLQDLRDERDSYDDPHLRVGNCCDTEAEAWAMEYPEAAAELKALERASGDCESQEDADQRIHEDPWSLQLRSGWYEPGTRSPKAEEFELLLTTGGPAVRIIGELTNGEPTAATLQVQDWFTPWTDYRPAHSDVLLAYCRVFYFGE